MHINLRDRLKNRENIPEKQQLLILVLQNSRGQREFIEHLAFGHTEKRKTILMKSKNMDLFTDMERAYRASERDELSESGASVLFYVFIGLGLFVLAVMIVLIKVIAPSLEIE